MSSLSPVLGFSSGPQFHTGDLVQYVKAVLHNETQLPMSMVNSPPVPSRHCRLELQ